MLKSIEEVDLKGKGFIIHLNPRRPHEAALF